MYYVLYNNYSESNLILKKLDSACTSPCPMAFYAIFADPVCRSDAPSLYWCHWNLVAIWLSNWLALKLNYTDLVQNNRRIRKYVSHTCTLLCRTIEAQNLCERLHDLFCVLFICFFFDKRNTQFNVCELL